MKQHVKATRSSPWISRAATTILWLSAKVPLAASRGFATLIGWLASWIPNELQSTSELNLKLCFPELDAADRRRIVRRSLQSTAGQFLELGPLWSWQLDRLPTFEAGIEGEDLLLDALDSGRGVVLLTPHFGNWEVLNHVIMRSTPLTSLYRSPRVAELDEIVRRGRERTGCAMAPATRGGVRTILRSLRNGRLVLVLPDQEPLKSNGVFAPFFGREALTMTLVPQLLRRTGAVPLFVVAQRLDDGRFRVRFLPAPEGLADDDEVVAATALNRGIEACIRLDPGQYLWSYKRFRTTRPGQISPYRAVWSRRRRRRNRQAARRRSRHEGSANPADSRSSSS